MTTVEAFNASVAAHNTSLAWTDRAAENPCPTFLPHVHVVDLPVAVLWLTDATVGQRVAGVVGVHAEVEVVTGVSHGQLTETRRTGRVSDTFKNNISSTRRRCITEQMTQRMKNQRFSSRWCLLKFTQFQNFVPCPESGVRTNDMIWVLIRVGDRRTHRNLPLCSTLFHFVPLRVSAALNARLLSVDFKSISGSNEISM